LQEQNFDTLEWNPTTTPQFTTDEHGIILIENLHPGQTYRIRQISVPAPYAPDLTWHEFQPISNQIFELRFYSTYPVLDNINNGIHENAPVENFNPEQDDEVKITVEAPSTPDSEKEEVVEYNDIPVEQETNDYLPQTGMQETHLPLFFGVVLVAIGLIITNTFIKKGGTEHDTN